MCLNGYVARGIKIEIAGKAAFFGPPQLPRSGEGLGHQDEFFYCGAKNSRKAFLEPWGHPRPTAIMKLKFMG